MTVAMNNYHRLQIHKHNLELCSPGLIWQTSHVSVLYILCQEKKDCTLGGLTIWE